jgi:hypothetical protein
MTQMDVRKLAEIPFLNHSDLQGRFLCSLMFYDGQWHAWIDAGDQVFKTQMWPAEAVYFGASPELQTDMYFYFMDIIAQRLSFLPLGHALFALQDDVFNLSASLAKIQLLHERKQDLKGGVSRMVVTEMEYMHAVCRSIFDLWQEVLIAVWKSVRLPDSKALKKSYREMIFSSGQPRTVDELTTRFTIPMALAECYVRSADFFADLRKLRDNIIHQGASVPVIFEGENGFLISERRIPFRELRMWRSEEQEPNGLVPLMPALAYVIRRTLGTCDDFAQTLARIFRLAPPLVPNMKLFLGDTSI